MNTGKAPKTKNMRNGWNWPEREEEEKKKDKVICKHCGNDTFRVYITIIIDDARLYCTNCGKNPEY